MPIKPAQIFNQICFVSWFSVCVMCYRVYSRSTSPAVIIITVALDPTTDQGSSFGNSRRICELFHTIADNLRKDLLLMRNTICSEYIDCIYLPNRTLKNKSFNEFFINFIAVTHGDFFTIFLVAATNIFFSSNFD